MGKYTEEQLFEIQEQAHIPQPEVLEAFNKLVESVAIELANSSKKFHGPHNGDTFIDEFGNERSYTSFNRRRGSHSGKKPLKKKAGEVAVDDDGWATLTNVKAKKSFGEDALEEKDKFRDSIKSETAKVKPSAKKMGSNKAVDARDVVADKQTIKFNAFEALGGDDDEIIDDDEDEE